MFFHDKRLQYHSKPDQPDPIFAHRLQEVIGGQWGEMSVMTSYLFQGWNCRGPQKYKDLLLDTAAEEIGHVEMLSTMVARLLEGAPVEAQQAAVDGNPAVAAVMGGMNPQHAIVTGGGAAPTDSVGYPFNARYTIASGNLLADFRYNVTAESQGRLQVTRLYAMTQDAGVRDMLSFLIARDTMHQNQWLAAIQDLENEGLEMTPCPSSFPQQDELLDVSYQLWNLSSGDEAGDGRWANGPSMDGKGSFEFVRDPRPMGDVPILPPADPRLHGTPPTPAMAMPVSGDD